MKIFSLETRDFKRNGNSTTKLHINTRLEITAILMKIFRVSFDRERHWVKQTRRHADVTCDFDGEHEDRARNAKRATNR